MVCWLPRKRLLIDPTSTRLGALGSWGAALLAPYSDKPETSGLLLTPPEEMSSLIHQFWKDGFQTVGTFVLFL